MPMHMQIVRACFAYVPHEMYLLECVGDELCGLGVTFGPDNGGLLLLFRTHHDKLGALGTLLRDLLVLNGLGKVRGEGQVGDGHVVEEEVELLATGEKTLLDLAGDLITLRDQLVRVVLRDNSLENLVTDGGEDALGVVEAECAVDLGQGLSLGTREDTERDGDLLQVLRARHGGNNAGNCANAHDHRVLDEGNTNMPSFGVNL